MSYAAAEDLTNRYPNRDLVQLTNEDPAAATVNFALLTQALADASAEIDGYLGGRFTLPLTDPPAVLNRLACDIAMYRLQVLRPLSDVAEARKRYEDAIAMLQRAAAGELTLGVGADGLETATAAGAGQLEGSTRIFSRGTMKGF